MGLTGDRRIRGATGENAINEQSILIFISYFYSKGNPGADINVPATRPWLLTPL